MTKLEFEKLLIPLIEFMNNIEMDLIYNILSRIDNYTSIKGSLEWYIDKLAELKLLDKDNLKAFKKNKQELKKIIEELANNCGNHIDNLDKLNEYYEKGLLNKNPISLYESQAIKSLIDEAIKDTSDIMSLIQTKAIEGSNKAYKDILNKAYIETAGGAYTYTESIKRALDEFAEKGIKAAHYKNGTSLSIESVVRRDVITRMNKLVGDCELEHAKELDTNLVYVDQHLGARIRTPYIKNDYEAHCEWQGKKYMIDGSNDKYDNLYEKTGYGEMLGLKGINCYHNMRPTWEWEEIPKQIDLKENARVREILDKRNYYARKIRTLKHKRLNSKILGDKEEYKKINNEYVYTDKQYNSFLEKNNLVRDYNKEYVNNSWISSLTEDEKYSLNSYISSDSYIINDALRNNYPLDDRLNNVVKNLDSVLDKIPNSKGTFNRSLFFDNEDNYNEFIKSLSSLSGKIKFKSFISMSKDIYDEKDNIRLIMKCKTAKDISMINKNEQELLLKRNTSFKILKKYYVNGKLFVDMEEL